MMEAQATFQRVVKQELQVLLASGLEREVAVRILLHRIVESTEEPEESDVKRVMRQFQMNYDDAVRALIVKQEIGRLKRQGLDAFAAIEELTRKMKQITVPSAAGSEVEMTDDQELTTTDADMRISEAEATADEQEEKADTDTAGDNDASSRIQSTTEDSTANQVMDGSQSTLCEQIDQFSISTVSQSSAASLSTTQPSESSRTAFTFFSTTSRKRRVASGDASPSYHGQPEPMEASQVRIPPFHRPLSPTFRFPKKQKLWTEDDEISDAPVYDEDDSSSNHPTPLSPTGVGARDETPPPSNAPTPTKIGKRRRALHGASSPELDDIDVDDGVLVRVTKRHKL